MASSSLALLAPAWVHGTYPALFAAGQHLSFSFSRTGICNSSRNSSIQSTAFSGINRSTHSSSSTQHRSSALRRIQQQLIRHSNHQPLCQHSNRQYCKWATPTNPVAAEVQPAAATPPEQQQQQPQSAAEAASSFINTDAATASATAAAGGAATGGAAAAAAASAGGVLAGVTAAPTAEYTMRQVSKHATDETCWIVVNGKVYDVTSYIDDHPGGAESILLNAGVDCTEEFMGVHSQEAKELLEKFVIGKVKAGSKKVKPAAAAEQQAAAAAPKPMPRGPLVTLQDPRERYALPLAEKKQLNHDTFFMRFELPSPQHKLGLPCGKHVFLCADINGEAVVRAYTPISGDRELGVLDFLIKVYWAGSHPKFPHGGKMSQYLAAMKEGDKLDVKGPYGKFTYEGTGQYNLNRVQGKARYMSMVAGGSGITPCYSVLKEVLRNPDDHTRCSLIYANKHEEDIWLREELDAMARNNPDRFHLWYVLEEPGTAPTPVTRTAETAAAALAAIGSGQPIPSVNPSVVNPRQQQDFDSGLGLDINPQHLVNPAGAPLWTFSKGYITHDMMAQHLLPPQPVQVASNVTSNITDQQQQQEAAGSLALMCGPPGMLEGVVVPGLAAMGYSALQMVLF